VRHRPLNHAFRGSRRPHRHWRPHWSL